MKLTNYFKRSLSRRFLLLMGIFFMFFVVAAGGMIAAFQYLNESYVLKTADLERKEQLARVIDETFTDAISDVRGYIAYRNTALKDRALAQEPRVNNLVLRFKEVAASTEDVEFIEKVENFAVYYFVKTVPPVIEDLENGNVEAVIRTANTGATANINAFKLELDIYLRDLDRQLTNSYQDLKRQQTNVQIAFVVFVLTILFVLLQISILMLRQVGQPLGKLAIAANEIALGREAVIDVQANRDDELGVLSVAFKKMAESIKEKEQNLLAQNEELTAQQEELQAQQAELEETLEVLRENEDKLQKRNNLVNTISTSLDKQEVLESIVTNTCRIIDADSGLILLLDGNIHASLGVSAEGVTQFREHFYKSGLRQKLEGLRQPLSVKRLVDTSEKGFHIENQYQYDLYLPVFNGENSLSAVMVFSRFGQYFDENQMQEYLAISRSIGLALEKINLYEATEKDRRLNQNILDTVQEGIQMVSNDGSILQVNNQVCQMFNCTRNIQEIVGMKREFWIDWMKGFVEEEKEFQEFVQEALQRKDQGDFTEEATLVYRKKDNDQVYKVYCKDLYHGNEKIGTIFVHRNMTKEYEVDQMKSDFVSTVSHELRTPLASILGFTELMLNRELRAEKQNKYLTTIYTEAKRLTSLINDFLDVQRLEAGKQAYEKKYIHLKPIIERVVDIQKINAPKHTFSLNLNEKEDYILGDQAKVEQVFMNLISNAIKYSPDGGQITITTSGSDKELRVAIQDEGLGIPEESIEKLFSKFYRVDNTDRRKIGGTGLGLAIVKEIMKAHDGDVGVESEYGEGSTFTVVFPIYQVRDAESKSADELGDFEKSYEIMIIEDDQSLAELMIHELHDSGFHVSYYKKGVAALAALYSEVPDAIVLDILLEDDDLDGWNVMKEIKSKDALKNVPIIVSTALDDKDKGFSLGAVDYLIKPYQPSQLSKAIMQTLLKIGKVGQILVPEEKK